MINIISLGAGKQSSYLLLEALKGKFGVIPDMAIFSDTGCEPDYVYAYLDWLKNKVAPFPIITVTEGDIISDTLEYLKGKRKRVASLPLRLGNKGGLIMRQCTNDYKIRPLRKYVQKIRKGRNIKLWIGISLDEMERMATSNVRYITNHYPLIESKIRISDIIKYFKDNNLPEPSKSACLICPFHSDNYWKAFKSKYPIEFEKACKFDEAIRVYPNLKQKSYLSKHLKPLRDIDFDSQQTLQFPELIEECGGLCGL
jgi:hypothetical protein